MNIRTSIVKVTNHNRATGRLVDCGSGAVIHASGQRALIAAAAHVVCSREFESFMDVAGYNRALRYQIGLSGSEPEIEAKYVCLPEHGFPDIALLQITGQAATDLTALPIRRSDFDSGEVRIFGFAAESRVFAELRGRFEHWLSGEKFPECAIPVIPGDPPPGFSGGPILFDNQIVGLVKGATDATMHGLSYISIRRMLGNWAAGKYTSPPYDRFRDGDLPSVTPLPAEIRDILREL